MVFSSRDEIGFGISEVSHVFNSCCTLIWLYCAFFRMSTEVQAVLKVDSLHGSGKRKHKETLQRRTLSIPTPFPTKKQKPEEPKHFKSSKKRSQSFTGGKLHPPYKKRKKEKLIPPTKFLLGGNIRDPLNLNSLQDEEVNRAMNAVTPESSPLPTPQHRKGVVEVIIPADIHDPLSLAGGEEDDEAYAASFNTTNPHTPRKVKKKNRKRKSKGGSRDEPDGKQVTCSPRQENSPSTSPNMKQSSPSKSLLLRFLSSSDKSQDETKEEDESTHEVDTSTEASLTEDLDKSKEEQKEDEIEKQVVENEKEKDKKSEKEKEKEKKSEKEKEKEKKIEKEKDFKRPKLNLDKKDKKPGVQDMKDRIVSPVIPQPGAWPGSGRFRKQGPRRPNQPTPKFKESGRKFQYGNYNRYYGYRNPGQESDPRLKVFASLQHLFVGKDVLDIGCNTGVVSVAVARDLGARSVVGIDIDKSLVEAARQRLRRSSKEFPVSMPLVYGPLDVPGVQEANTFPHNLTFIQGNYVLENDVLVELEQAQFDVILCLSVTKWFHLNWGDGGLKRAFKRMFCQLRPGGVLILEPQDWSSYKRKKNLTETTWKNYQSIQLFPARFSEFLLSTEVGFSKCEVVGAPIHPAKGFQRPIKVFTKGETPLFSRTPHAEGSSLAATPREEQDSHSPSGVERNTGNMDVDSSVVNTSGKDLPLTSELVRTEPSAESMTIGVDNSSRGVNDVA